jgi:hypothetical protein
MADARKLLGTYLNDHLAGSMVGGELARRITRRNSDNEYGRETAEIAEQIEQDQLELRRIMTRLDVRQKRLRLGVAWMMKSLTRMKPNGRLFGYSPLSRVLELEGLVMGITGKLELWRTLDQIEGAYPALDEAQVRQLIGRAESQRDRVEDLRLNAVSEALNGS